MFKSAVLIALLLLPVEIGSLGCGCDLEVVNSSLPDAVVGISYKVDLDSKCGGDSWFLEDGSLPPGISLLEDGKLRGTPGQPGTFIFTVGVVDFDNDDHA